MAVILIRRLRLLMFLPAVLVLGFGFVYASHQYYPLAGKLIVINAGASDYTADCDEFSVPLSGIELAVASMLETALTKQGAKVLVTRDYNLASDETLLTGLGDKIDLVIELELNASNDVFGFGPHPTCNSGSKMASYIKLELAKNLKSKRVCTPPIYPGDFAHPLLTVDLGYATDPEQAALLSLSAYQAKLAEALSAGITRYYRSFDEA